MCVCVGGGVGREGAWGGGVPYYLMNFFLSLLLITRSKNASPFDNIVSLLIRTADSWK